MFFRRNSKALLDMAEQNGRWIEANYSAWSIRMQLKTSIFLLYDSGQKEGDFDKRQETYKMWLLIEELMQILTLDAFEFIYKNSPEAKKHVDGLINNGRYDVGCAKRAIVSYGLALYMVAKNKVTNRKMTPEEVDDFLFYLRFNSKEKMDIAKQSCNISKNIEQLEQSKKTTATFYVDFVLGLSNYDLAEYAGIGFYDFLLSPMSEVFFWDRTTDAINGMVRIIYSDIQVMDQIKREINEKYGV